MRAPSFRRTGGNQTSQTAGSAKLTEAKHDAAPGLSPDELFNNGEFHRRLAEARVRREEALRLRKEGAGEAPATPQVVPPAASFSSLLQSPPPNTLAKRLAAASDGALDPVTTRQADTPPSASPQQVRIELSEEGAARRRLGAAMALSALPERPLEPALVPLVSGSVLAGFMARPAVPAAFAVGAFCLLGWMMLSGGQPPATPVTKPSPVAVAELESKTALPLPTPVPSPSPAPVQVAEPIKAPALASEPKKAGDLPDVTRDSLVDEAVEYARAIVPGLKAEPATKIAVAPLEAISPPLLENLSALTPARRPLARPDIAAEAPPAPGRLASAIDLAVQEALAEAAPLPRPDTTASFVPAVANLGPAQSGARPDRPLVIHVPDGLVGAGADIPVDRINALVTPYVTSKQVPFDVAETHVRVYHTADLPAGRDVAERLDIGIRDMSGFEPRPPEGLIELWWQGDAAPKRIVSESSPIRISSTAPTAAVSTAATPENSILKENPSANDAWVPARRFQSGDGAEAATRANALQSVASLPKAVPIQTFAEKPSGLRALFKRLPDDDDEAKSEFLRPPEQ